MHRLIVSSSNLVAKMPILKQFWTLGPNPIFKIYIMSDILPVNKKEFALNGLKLNKIKCLFVPLNRFLYEPHLKPT